MECSLCGTQNENGITICVICDTNLVENSALAFGKNEIKLSTKELKQSGKIFGELKKQEKEIYSEPEGWVELKTTDISSYRFEWRGILLLLLSVMIVVPLLFSRDYFLVPPQTQAAIALYTACEKNYQEQKEKWQGKKRNLLDELRTHGKGGFRNAPAIKVNQVPYEVLLAYLLTDAHFPTDRSILLPLPEKGRLLLAKKHNSFFPLSVPASAVLEITQNVKGGGLAIEILSFQRGVRNLPIELAKNAFLEEFTALAKMEEFYNGVEQLSWECMPEGSPLISFTYHPSHGTLSHALKERMTDEVTDALEDEAMISNKVGE